MNDNPTKRDQSADPDTDPLRLVLHTMEEQLDDRVGAVSSARPSHEESTSALIRLEETLSSAQDKAKQLVTLRLKLGEEASVEQSHADAPGNAAVPAHAVTPAPTEPATHPDKPAPPPPR